jgi:hypothetical protein
LSSRFTALVACVIFCFFCTLLITSLSLSFYFVSLAVIMPTFHFIHVTNSVLYTSRSLSFRPLVSSSFYAFTLCQVSCQVLSYFLFLKASGPSRFMQLTNSTAWIHHCLVTEDSQGFRRFSKSSTMTTGLRDKSCMSKRWFTCL